MQLRRAQRLALSGSVVQASIAYGSINNFDTVNDTGVPCHGFEVELDDIHTTDITYTYDCNHYGTPKITEDTQQGSKTHRCPRPLSGGLDEYGLVGLHRRADHQHPADASHAFTNPSLNFGGEHFGVGYRTQPSKVLYHWLVDTGNHILSVGPQVNVSTPTFTSPVAVPLPQVVAVIPAPILPRINEFSDAPGSRRS